MISNTLLFHNNSFYLSWRRLGINKNTYHANLPMKLQARSKEKNEDLPRKPLQRQMYASDEASRKDGRPTPAMTSSGGESIRGDWLTERQRVARVDCKAA